MAPFVQQDASWTPPRTSKPVQGGDEPVQDVLVDVLVQEQAGEHAVQL
ncbi:hypothetical protein [Rhodococcus jostii]